MSALLPISTAMVTNAPPAPPIWGPVMTAPFNQSITILGFTWSNTVQYFYDAVSTPVGQSLYVHSEGQHDELCTSIKGREFSSEPCSLLASEDTWRYVIFPQSASCCRYCNTTEYCGIIKPTWLQTNATYEGTAVVSGQTCNWWAKQGGESNNALFLPSGQPCAYYEGYPTFQVGNNTWTFDLSAFSRAAIPASTFTVPPGMGCEAACVTSEMSYEERLAGAFRRPV